MTDVTSQSVLLERGDWQVRLTPESWAQILLLLEDHGWVPVEQTRTAYYLGTTDVSKLDADAMADCGGRVLTITLNNPLKTYPAAVDMARLAEFVEFSKGGSFQITWKHLRNAPR